MNLLKKDFIKLAIEFQALKFGKFTLKSGRQSPYFFNFGVFNNGIGMKEIGRLYANKIIACNIAFEHLFGPAYKGISIATSTSIALANEGINKTLTFNRKEAKEHGEKGELIGASLTGKTLIVDDVITAGTAFRQAKHFIEQNGAKVIGVIIALDRCENTGKNKTAISEIQDEGIKVISIINIFDIIDYLQEEGINSADLKVLEQYVNINCIRNSIN